ncbi:hypothetical protein [Streptomyces sasae]|uniref:hypothetical protein n=1 Tax=Streptomyces sasae TaxID=1266772 RepID=UPI00292F45CB|nr:hypothetical protein [Streptomyces sasae]
MTISPSTTEHGKRLLERLERFATRNDGQVAVARRLLADHPDLPLFGFMVSHSIEPEPGKPAHSLILQVGQYNTDAIAAWASALGTEPAIDGARHTLTAAINGIGIHATAVVYDALYDIEKAVFTPTADDVTCTYRGLLVTSLGDDGRLLIVGHPPARDVLIAASAFYRDTCGQRLRPFNGNDLADSIARTWGRFIAYPNRSEWQLQGCWETTPGAMPVTWVYTDEADTQDLADIAGHCPKCGRTSRGLGHHPVDWTRVYLCPSSACGHRWPVPDLPTTKDTV